MTEPSRRYDVTITVDQGGRHLNLAEFAVAAQLAASARAASIVSAHTAGQIVSIVTVLAADQPAAVPALYGRRVRCLGALTGCRRALVPGWLESPVGAVHLIPRWTVSRAQLGA